MTRTMGIPEVVTIEGLQARLADGWELHVMCREEPETRSTHVHGLWYIIVVDPNTQNWAPLITRRGQSKERKRAEQMGEKLNPADLALREIRTATGLYNIQRELGVTAVVVPSVAGQSMVTWKS